MISCRTAKIAASFLVPEKGPWRSVGFQSVRRKRPRLMREIDVPVRVNGRHWGGFRTAYKL